MSIDDAIVILQSDSPDGGAEYRVRHVYAGVPVSWGDPYVYWPEGYTLQDYEAELRRRFAGALVFEEWELAVDEARRLKAYALKASPWGQTENGVVVVDIGRLFPSLPAVVPA